LFSLSSRLIVFDLGNQKRHAVAMCRGASGNSTTNSKKSFTVLMPEFLESIQNLKLLCTFNLSLD
jgi:hypothetical protein